MVVNSVSGRWARLSQCVVVQLWSKITYRLWAGNGRDGVSACCATMEQGHVPAVGESRARRSECGVVQLSSKVTYKLWAGDGHGVSV